MSVFEIRGNARNEYNYDIAVVDIQFQSVGTNIADVSNKTINECESFLAEMKKIGIEPSHFQMISDDIENCSYRDDTSVRAERKIRIKIPYDMKLINTIRQILNKEKYSAYFDLSFELSNERELQAEMQKEALLDSKARAEKLANTLGLKLIKIKSVATQGSERDYRMDWMETEQEDTLFLRTINLVDSLNSDELQADKRELSATVDVKWIIE